MRIPRSIIFHLIIDILQYVAYRCLLPNANQCTHNSVVASMDGKWRDKTRQFNRIIAFAVTVIAQIQSDAHLFAIHLYGSWFAFFKQINVAVNGMLFQKPIQPLNVYDCVCVLVRPAYTPNGPKKDRAETCYFSSKGTKQKPQSIELPHTSKINGNWSFITTTIIMIFPRHSSYFAAPLCIICALCCAHCADQINKRKFYMAHTHTHCNLIQLKTNWRTKSVKHTHEMKTNTRTIWSLARSVLLVSVNIHSERTSDQQAEREEGKRIDENERI